MYETIKGSEPVLPEPGRLNCSPSEELRFISTKEITFIMFKIMKTKKFMIEINLKYFIFKNAITLFKSLENSISFC
ncbi:hypothetical protein LCGC14_2345180 [marine sediment metagenome]|uniref:Uncharacterized protein n=1 Tax=marine sediment metagenome TaxID=412755 RepID=A0A0F9ENI6_9ZZZZ